MWPCSFWRALCLHAFPARDQLILCIDSSQTQPRHFNRVARHLILVPGEPEATACLVGVCLADTLCDLAVGSLALAADLT
jgi:hypothetical protein